MNREQSVDDLIEKNFNHWGKITKMEVKELIAMCNRIGLIAPPKTMQSDDPRKTPTHSERNAINELEKRYLEHYGFNTAIMASRHKTPLQYMFSAKLLYTLVYKAKCRRSVLCNQFGLSQANLHRLVHYYITNKENVENALSGLIIA
jgi:hypothetical protein